MEMFNDKKVDNVTLYNHDEEFIDLYVYIMKN